MAILILWRHLDYYLSSRTATPSGSSFPVTRPSLSLYNRRDPVTDQLKTASRDVLLPMMDDMNERLTAELVRIAVSVAVLLHCSLADKLVLKFSIEEYAVRTTKKISSYGNTQNQDTYSKRKLIIKTSSYIVDDSFTGLIEC